MDGEEWISIRRACSVRKTLSLAADSARIAAAASMAWPTPALSAMVDASESPAAVAAAAADDDDDDDDAAAVLLSTCIAGLALRAAAT